MSEFDVFYCYWICNCRCHCCFIWLFFKCDINCIFFLYLVFSAIFYAFQTNCVFFSFFYAVFKKKVWNCLFNCMTVHLPHLHIHALFKFFFFLGLNLIFFFDFKNIPIKFHQLIYFRIIRIFISLYSLKI